MNMANTEAGHTTYPITHYWELVKDMEDSQKLELITMLAQSVKPAVCDDEYEKEFYTPEETYEIVMKDVKSIYARKDGI
jgi:hypothetical protein